MDWENSNGKKDLNKDLNKQEEKEKESVLNKINDCNRNKVEVFIDYYENSCNYIIFLRNSSAYLNKKDINMYKDISLDKFFKVFQKVSLFGLKINYLSNNLNEQCNMNNNNKNVSIINYSLTLSSFEISFNNKEIILNIIDYLISTNKCTNQLKSKIEENYGKDQIININNIKLNSSFVLDCGTNESIELKESGTMLYCTLKGTNTVEGVNNKPPFIEAGSIEDTFGNIFLEYKPLNLKSPNCYAIYDKASCEVNHNCVFSKDYYGFCDNKNNLISNTSEILYESNVFESYQSY